MKVVPIDLSKIHVVTMISNPRRYESRYRLYEEFKEHIVHDCKVNLWTAEVAFGQREFRVTNPHEPRDIQLYTYDELWIKERALQLAVWRLTEDFPDWEYVVWSDSDIVFQNRDWLTETWQQLQHYAVVQCFQNAIDLGPDGRALHTHTGFAFSYVTGRPYKSGYHDWHPGYVWAARREAFRATGFYDAAILGSGDRHMACGWIGKIQQSVNGGVSPGYKAKLAAWQAKAEREVRRNIGYVPGTILHKWHGKKADRQYRDRWRILVENQYDPDVDIVPDEQGLYRLVDDGTPRAIKLRDDIRKYFSARNEDSIDLE